MRSLIATAALVSSVSAFAQVSPLPPVRTSPSLPSVSNGAIEVPVTRNDSLVLTVPDRIRYSNIEANSDRTITVYNPKVYRVGAWRKIDYQNSSENGICNLVSRGMVAIDKETANVNYPGERMVAVGENGNVVSFGNAITTYSWIICARPR